jgi:hypothetical protein
LLFAQLPRQEHALSNRNGQPGGCIISVVRLDGMIDANLGSIASLFGASHRPIIIGTSALNAKNTKR